MKKKIWRNIVLVFMVVIGCLYGGEVYAANDSFVTATNISVNTSITDNLTYGADSNYYKFFIPRNGKIVINFSHIELEYNHKEWVIELYDGNRNKLMYIDAWGSHALDKSVEYGLPAGTYYVMVEAYNSYEYEDVNYQLRINYSVADNWETEDNYGFTIADPLLINKTIYGNIDNGSDCDFYKVALSKNGYVTMEFNHPILETQNNRWRIRLFDSSRNELEEVYSAGYETCKKIDFGYLTKGSYYIRVEAQDALMDVFDPATYNLKVVYTTPKASISSAKSTSSKKMTVKWKKLKAVSGYEIITATDKKFKKNKKITTVNGSKKVKTTIKKLKRKKTYYVKMRGYITVDGQKYYGPYSKAKKVKVK